MDLEGLKYLCHQVGVDQGAMAAVIDPGDRRKRSDKEDDLKEMGFKKGARMKLKKKFKK